MSAIDTTFICIKKSTEGPIRHKKKWQSSSDKQKQNCNLLFRDDLSSASLDPLGDRSSLGITMEPAAARALPPWLACLLLALLMMIEGRGKKKVMNVQGDNLG